MTDKKNKWNKEVITFMLSSIYDNFNKWIIKDISLNSEILINLSEVMSKKFNNDYNANSILCKLYGLPCIFDTSTDYRKKPNLFVKSPEKFIYIKDKSIKYFIAALFNKVNEKIDTVDLEVGDYNSKLSMQDNIENLMLTMNISKLSAYMSLLKKGILELTKDKDLIVSKAINKSTIIPVLSSQNPVKNLRVEISKIFNHYGDKNLFLLNDGTGSGKTYNAVLNFIKFSNKNVRKIMVFSAPQKNQLVISADIYKESINKDVSILVYRSTIDLCNLDMNNLAVIDDINLGSFEKQADTLNRIFSSIETKSLNRKIKYYYFERQKIVKGLDEDTTDDEITKWSDKKHPDIMDVKKVYTAYMNICEEEEKESYPDLDKYKEEKTKLGKEFTLAIRNLAEFFAMAIPNNELDSIVNSSSTRGKNEEFIYQLLCFVLPFEIAKFKNIVILLTTDKAATRIAYSEERERNSKKYKIILKKPIDFLMSGCDDKKVANIFKYLKSSDEEVSNYFRNDFFEIIGNYYTNNNISFSYVIDEEHTAYNKILNGYSYKDIINEEVNLVHSLSTIHRWINNSKPKKMNKIIVNEKFNNQKVSLINELRKVLKEKTVFTDDTKIDNFFKFVSDNEQGIYIHKKDYDFITSVCQNIMAFTSKVIMNQELLKSIKIYPNTDEDVVYLYKDIQEKDKNMMEEEYTLHDLLQVILCLFYVSRKMTQKSLNYFRNSMEDNQNNPLYTLIYQAVKHKDYLEDMFDSYTNVTETEEINILFAYFLSKIVFSCDYNFKGTLNEDSSYIKIRLNIFLINELPEVNILRILQQKNNKVFLLSATRGLNNIFSGNYSEEFFKQVNEKYFNNNLINIDKRENYEDNPMVEFIEDRFRKRNSVTINKIKYDNNIAYIEEFKIKNINNVNAENAKEGIDVSDKIESYASKVEENNLMFDIVEKLKSNSSYKNIRNHFHKKEIEGVWNSIAHAFHNNKNAMIMTLTNNFYKEIVKSKTNNMMSNVFGSDYSVKENIIGDENKGKIFDISPIRGTNKKIRIVCFDAELGKMPNLKDLMKKDPNTILILVSSFVSAGTGLNLTQDENTDFESLYFISSPYYTSIKDSKFGLCNISNYLLLMKNLAYKGNKTIEYFKDGLNNPDLFRILMDEHLMEYVKTIMQAAGRIERRDCKIDTSIYFVNNDRNELFEDIMFGFSQIYKIHKELDVSILDNFSLLNKSILKASLYYASRHSFDPKSRKKMKNISKDSFNMVSKFFKEDYTDALSQYRQGNENYKWFKEFNEIIRGYTNPYYDIVKKLNDFINKNNGLLMQCAFKNKIVLLRDNVIINIPSHCSNVKIGINYNDFCYTDITETGYKIDNYILFSYADELKVNAIDNNLSDFYKQYIMSHNSECNVDLEIVPDIYFKDIIKGNVGEMIFECYLKEHNVKYNNMKEWFGEPIAKRTYELFDFYILNNSTLYCVDVKNWNVNNDNAFKKTNSRIDDKVDTIRNLVDNKYNIEFIYLNMHPEKNSNVSDGLNVHLGKRALYMNFISRVPNIVEGKNVEKFIISMDLEEKVK